VQKKKGSMTKGELRKSSRGAPGPGGGKKNYKTKKKCEGGGEKQPGQINPVPQFETSLQRGKMYHRGNPELRRFKMGKGDDLEEAAAITF